MFSDLATLSFSLIYEQGEQWDTKVGKLIVDFYS